MMHLYLAVACLLVSVVALWDEACAEASSPSTDMRLHTCFLINKDEREHDAMFHQKQFHNHLDYHIVALLNNGASVEQLDLAYAAESAPLDPANPSHGRVTDETYEMYLGRYNTNPDDSYYLDFVDYFAGRAKSTPGGAIGVLQEALPRLNCSAACMLFHPLIQLGYAFEMPGNDERMIVQGLAWMSTGFLPDTTPLKLTKLTDPIVVFGQLERDSRIPAGQVQLQKVAVLYGDVIADYDLDVSSVQSTLDAIADAVLRMFHVTGSDSFDLLHLVTSCRALRKLLPQITDTALQKDLLSYYWRGVLYLYTALARPHVPTIPPHVDHSSLRPFDELIKAASSFQDAHLHKMLWLCRDEVQNRKNDLLYHLTANVIVANFTAGRPWVH